MIYFGYCHFMLPHCIHQLIKQFLLKLNWCNQITEQLVSCWYNVC